jgi:hypothetical protein
MMVRNEYQRKIMQSQQDYLRAVKDEIGVTWDALAGMAGIEPRALKTYRMPDSSKDYRSLPRLAKDALDRVLADHQKKLKRSAKSS